MINLKNIAIDTREVTVPYPGLDGFELKLQHVSRPKSTAIYKGAQVTKMVNGRAAQELDADKFNMDFATYAIIGWSGLTVAMLDQLLLIDTKDLSPDDIVEYNAENAATLMQHSAAFEEFINATVFNLDSFRSIK